MDKVSVKMPLRVSGKNLDIGQSLRTHVLEKVQTLIARYFDGKVTGHVVISPEGSAFRTDCALHLSSGVNLQSEGRAHEPYTSFEQAADKIERRLRRYKKRLKEHATSHEPPADIGDRREVAKFVIEAPADDDQEAPVDYSPAVVAEGAHPLKTMSVASAVSELDLTGAPLIVFQHATSSRINIVYRRRDGAIGWLDPR
jgi:ribosomal subunit interface protein